MSVPFIISVMSRDRVGIVADVTNAVKQLQGNLEDISQTVLKGYFSMILMARFPENVTEASLRQALHECRGLSTFEIGVLPFSGEETQVAPEDEKDAYIVTVSGPDKVGLVAAISEYMRIKKINILDLATRSENGVYTMILLVRLPQGVDVARLKRSLKMAMEEHKMTVELRHQAIFRKVNEI